MYRQCSCLYRYSAYIFNIGTYSDPYTSIGATLLITEHVFTTTRHTYVGMFVVMSMQIFLKPVVNCLYAYCSENNNLTFSYGGFWNP